MFSFAVGSGGSRDPHVGERAARYCDAIWSGLVQLRVLQRGAAVGTTSFHQIRFVETTLFVSHFAVNVRNDVDSSVLLSNTTKDTYGVSITVFDAAGRIATSVAQIDLNLGPYASTEVRLSDYGVTRATGSIVVSSYGGPGALAAELRTVRNDGRTVVPFRPRQDYR